jgi:MerR family transcriptional regulator, light-induced transcriptional regulator
MRNDLLTVQEAANLIGVSASTFKRMCESESIPVFRTPGGHRRIDKMELDRVSRMHLQSRTEGDCTQASHAIITTEQVLADLLAGKSFDIAKRLSRVATSAAGLVLALEDYLIATLWKVGELWREGKIDVFQEHLCTTAALSALDILRQHVPNQFQGTSPAVGGSFAPNMETLPSKLVAISLELAGTRAIDLGGYLPAESLANAVKQYQAKLVWVTHTHVGDVEVLLENHRILRDNVPPMTRIMVGGGGLSPAIRRSLPWCEFYETLSQMHAAEQALHGPWIQSA